MKAVIQRVSRAEVRVDGNVTGRISRGFLILLGVAVGDTDADLNWIVEKVIHLRVFPNEAGKFDRSLLDVNGQALVVSQFTLFGDCRKGRRPGFTDAAPPETAEPVFKKAVDAFQAKGIHTEAGIFGAMMEVELINDGPVTLILDSRMT